ncbi:MAG TPA: abortive infection family protein [Patescibacteria group bacterium]|nr:abortive infection family protein [Patescibacteria group bacterium]
MEISPKYMMKLVKQIDETLWREFVSYKNVEFYLKKWQIPVSYNELNFGIYYSDDNIDAKQTLHNIDGETLIKIAIDLGIETPNFLPSIPTFRNVIKDEYNAAFDSFNKAISQIEINPDLAVGLANSTLESVVKHILEDEKVTVSWSKKDTLYDLVSSVLKQFELYPQKELPKEIKNIGSKLLSISQSVEDLRSEKTVLHGKLAKDYIIKDSLYAYFIVNSVSTLGLFLISFYEKKYPPTKTVLVSEDKNEGEVDPDDIPF